MPPPSKRAFSAREERCTAVGRPRARRQRAWQPSRPSPVPRRRRPHQAIRDACACSRLPFAFICAKLVCGQARGVPLNLMLLIGVYAAISKAFGLPLRFPGSPRAYEVLGQVTDAGLLARAAVWAATSPSAENQAFNLTNADCFRWCNVWPRLAAFFDMPCAPPQRLSLAAFMADKAPVWDRLVKAHALQPMPFAEVGDWGFADWVFATEWDYVMSDVKRIQAGFSEVVDSEVMFLRLLEEFRRDRVIP
jgi:hypothetical protein